ncbi:MAG: hypothetical protein ABJQ70_02500 [Roseobacter sp.]
MPKPLNLVVFHKTSTRVHPDMRLQDVQSIALPLDDLADCSVRRLTSMGLTEMIPHTAHKVTQ